MRSLALFFLCVVAFGADAQERVIRLAPDDAYIEHCLQLKLQSLAFNYERAGNDIDRRNAADAILAKVEQYGISPDDIKGDDLRSLVQRLLAAR
jgi:hypothetical protein